MMMLQHLLLLIVRLLACPLLRSRLQACLLLLATSHNYSCVQASALLLARLAGCSLPATLSWSCNCTLLLLASNLLVLLTNYRCAAVLQRHPCMLLASTLRRCW
jgi:hypothetical protein